MSRRRTYSDQSSNKSSLGWMGIRNRNNHIGLYVLPLDLIGRVPRYIYGEDISQDYIFTEISNYGGYTFVQRNLRDGYNNSYCTYMMDTRDMPLWDGFDMLSSSDIYRNNSALYPYGITKDGNLLYSYYLNTSNIDLTRLRITRSKFELNEQYHNSDFIKEIRPIIGPESSGDKYFNSGANVSQYIESQSANLILCTVNDSREATPILIYDDDPMNPVIGRYIDRSSIWYASSMDLTYKLEDVNKYSYSRGLDIENIGTEVNFTPQNSSEYTIYMTGDDNAAILVTTLYIDYYTNEYGIYKLNRSNYNRIATTSRPYIEIQNGYITASNSYETEVFDLDSGKSLYAFDIGLLRLIKG